MLLCYRMRAFALWRISQDQRGNIETMYRNSMISSILNFPRYANDMYLKGRKFNKNLNFTFSFMAYSLNLNSTVF